MKEFLTSNCALGVRSSTATMDGLPICFCSEIVLEILEDIAVEGHDVDRSVDAVMVDVEKEMTGLEEISGRKKSKNEEFLSETNMDILKETERGLTDDQVEEVLIEDPFESGHTEEIVCTEILENSDEEDDKTVESNDMPSPCMTCSMMLTEVGEEMKSKVWKLLSLNHP